MQLNHLKITFITLALILANISYSQSSINAEEVLAQVNLARKKGSMCGDEKMPAVKELSWNDKLEQAAQLHSDDMAKYDYMSHFGHNDDYIPDRYEMVGYDWAAFGEAVAFGQNDFETALDDWLTMSSGHCKLIMSSKFTEMGLARSTNAWTLNLGRPAEPQIIIPQNIQLDKQLMLKLVNELRKNGIECKGEIFPPAPPVIWDDDLEKIAQWHSDDMFSHNFFEHKGSDGSMVWDRLKWTKLQSSTLGENIAKGQLGEQQVLDDWLSSPTHCKVLMKAEFTKMGVAIKGDYWTQVFAQ